MVEFFIWCIQPKIVTAVVGGEQIAVGGMKGDVVWVAQAAGDDFALAAVYVEAHDGGAAAVCFGAGVAGGADAHVEPAIGAKLEVVVLVQSGGQAADNQFAHVGLVVAVGVAQQGNLAVAGNVDVVAAGADSDAQRGAEAGGKNGVAVGTAVAIHILQNMHRAVEGGHKKPSRVVKGEAGRTIDAGKGFEAEARRHDGSG